MITEFIIIGFYCFLVFLSVVGLAFLIVIMASRFLTAKGETTEVSAVFLKGENADIELKLLLEKYRCIGQRKAGSTVFVIDQCLPKELKHECKKIIKQYDFAVYIEKDSYIELVKGM